MNPAKRRRLAGVHESPPPIQPEKHAESTTANASKSSAATAAADESKTPTSESAKPTNAADASETGSGKMPQGSPTSTVWPSSPKSSSGAQRSASKAPATASKSKASEETSSDERHNEEWNLRWEVIRLQHQVIELQRQLEAHALRHAHPELTEMRATAIRELAKLLPTAVARARCKKGSPALLRLILRSLKGL
jgi:hypothetical protein